MRLHVHQVRSIISFFADGLHAEWTCLTDFNKLHEIYPDVLAPGLQDALESESEENAGSNDALYPWIDPVTEKTDIADFWAASYDLDRVSGLEVTGTQWPPGLHQANALPDRLNSATINHTLDGEPSLLNHLMEVDDPSEIYGLPTIDRASQLMSHYLDTVHHWIPILPYGFEEQVRIYYEAPLLVSNRWLATLNLVYAIGVRHSLLINRTQHTDGYHPREDLPCVSRATQLLEVNQSGLEASVPDLSLVQCQGLLALYYLTANQVERAWLIVGTAIRFAIALNLHLKCQDNTPWPSRAEMLSRTWWSLRSLECLLCSITGRPSTFPLQECNTPLPRIAPNLSEDIQSLKNLQLYTKISITTQRALTSLYSVRAASLPWTSIQKRVVKLKTELDTLIPDTSDPENLMLHLSWFDAIIIITRPCLCAPKNRTNLSDDELQLAQTIAQDCIQAARGVTRLLPDEPDERIYQIGPWWCISHYIIRTTTIFLLALSLPSSTGCDMNPIPSMKKLIRWLQWMQPNDAVAAQGLARILNTLQKSASHADFADVFKQRALDTTGNSLLDPDRWGGDDVEPMHFSEWDDFIDEDGAMNDMLSQNLDDMLPMAPVF
jgi:hypothetical protein